MFYLLDFKEAISIAVLAIFGNSVNHCKDLNNLSKAGKKIKPFFNPSDIEEIQILFSEEDLRKTYDEILKFTPLVDLIFSLLVVESNSTAIIQLPENPEDHILVYDLLTISRNLMLLKHPFSELLHPKISEEWINLLQPKNLSASYIEGNFSCNRRRAFVLSTFQIEPDKLIISDKQVKDFIEKTFDPSILRMLDLEHYSYFRFAFLGFRDEYIFLQINPSLNKNRQIKFVQHLTNNVFPLMAEQLTKQASDLLTNS